MTDINIKKIENLYIFHLIIQKESNSQSRIYSNIISYETLIFENNNLLLLSNTQEQLYEILNKIISKNNFKIIENKESFVVLRLYIEYIQSENSIFKKNPKYFNIDISLYSSNLREYNLELDEVQNKLNELKQINNQLNSDFSELEVNLKDINEENSYYIINDDLINERVIENINNYLVYQTDQLNSMSDMFNSRILDIKEKSKCRISVNNTNTYKKYSSIYRKDDYKLLSSFFGYEFKLFKIYESGNSDCILDIKDKTINKSQLIVFIESENKKRFGFYISIPWLWDSGKEKEINYLSNDPYSYIFSLDRKKKFEITNEKYIISLSNESISIGLGPDLYISSNFLEKTKNYSSLYGSYGRIENIEEGYTRNNYLVGIEYFKIHKIEIFQVYFE